MNFRLINIEEGFPSVAEAKKILEQEMARAKQAKMRAIKIIHGYGSSGVGGKIRTAVRKMMLEKKSKNEIAEFIPGEQWSIFNEETRKTLTLCPELTKDRDLDNCNIGVSIVLF